MNKTHLIYLTAIVVVAFALAGCGGGVTGHGVNREGSATGDVLTASGQVAAVMLVQEWAEILWGVLSTQTGGQTPTLTVPVANPDGSSTSTLTTADGTTGTITTYLDGSGRIDIVRPNGVTQTVTSSAPVDDGPKRTTDWTVACSDGVTVRYTSVVDDQGTWWDMTDDTTDLTGTSTLPGGVTQTFVVATTPAATTLRSVQSDGSVFTLYVLMTLPDFMPDYTKDATGTYVSANFNIAFTLSHTPAIANRWAAVSSDLGSQMTGDFKLDEDFSGYGQLQQTVAGGQKLSAVVKWTQQGDTQIDLLSGQSRQTQPAGAALDYLQHRWQTLAALKAPAPGP